MTDPTEVKQELKYEYQVEQKVSVNSNIDVEINGEVVRFLVTARHGSTAENIVKLTEAAITAYSMLRALYPKPVPSTKTPAIDENGIPIVDANTGAPVMTDLPPGVKVYRVAGLAHDKTATTKKDVLKVWTAEEPYNKGYGVSCFHPPAEIGNWKGWALMSKENKVRYPPPAGFELVLIRDPQGEGKYPDVIEFRKA